jgi:pimeloyl-ACP methyl ester carboxylesterase
MVDGGGILQQYELDHPGDLASLTLVASLSPYGFGGTKDPEGTLTWPDAAGSGGGTAAPDFVRRLAAGDASDEDPASSPRGIMRSFFWSPRSYQAPDEDELIQEVLLTAVGDEFCPGDARASENWPGVRPGTGGVNNAMAPLYCDTSAFGDVERPAPVLWIRGDEDQVVADASMFDFGQLGKIGAVPGWPGEDAFPPQPQVSQTRAVFDRRRARGSVREVVLKECGHGPLVERGPEVARLLVEHIDAGRPAGARA